jgi:autophagy-related protein 18
VVEMLFSSSLIAVVGAGEQPALSPRRLSVFNTSTGVNLAELNFVSSILAVCMNRKRMVVVLERKTYIHDLAQLTVLETIDTISNPRGIFSKPLNLPPLQSYICNILMQTHFFNMAFFFFFFFFFILC